MIEQVLTKYFKRFHAVAPSAEFASRSREHILSLPQLPAQRHALARLREAITSGTALALASFLLLAVLGGISYVTKQSAGVASSALSDEALMREAAQLSFEVQLNDAEYFDESASQVVRALDRLSGDGARVQ